MSMDEWNNYNWPLISFAFDDGGVNTYTAGLPLFQGFGVPACVGIIATYPGNEVAAMTWDQLRGLQSAGWEICSHSYDHDLAGWYPQSEEFMTTQTIASMEALTAQGLKVSNYICPGATPFPYDVVPDSVKHYHSARMTNVGVNQMPLACPAVWQLKVQNLDGRDIATCKAIIDTEMGYAAKGSRHWIIFYGHQFNAADVTFLTELLTYIQSKNLGIYTIQQALDIGGVVRND